MTVIIDSNRKAIENIAIVNSVEEAKLLKEFFNSKILPYEYELSNLLKLPDKQIHIDGERTNPRTLTCSCNKNSKNRKKYGETDLRLTCDHIYNAIIQSKELSDKIGSLSLLLMETYLHNNEDLLIRVSLTNTDENIYLGAKSKDKITLIIKEDNAWRKFSYETNKDKWSNCEKPKINKELADVIKSRKTLFETYFGDEK